jgi:alpha-tubulin suppressor-like RCC1 family protein
MKSLIRFALLALVALLALPALAQAATPKVAGAGDTSCVLSDAGALSCWGDNDLGTLGDGSQTDRHIAASPIGLSSGVVDFGLGTDLVCALRNDGKVLCWGSNNNGVITPGAADANPHPIPAVVPGVSDGVSIAVSNSGVCVVRSDSTAACWGHNLYGQVGDGQPDGQAAHVVVQVAGLSNIERIYPALFGNCALLKDRTVSCWGMNWNGQLGHGPGGFSDKSSTPTVVAGISGVVDFVGGESACVLLDTGVVRCWGDNSSYGLGNNAPGYSIAPVIVDGLGPVASLAGTYNSKCALSPAGNYTCWGTNGNKQFVSTSYSSMIATPVTFSPNTLVIGEPGSSQTMCWIVVGGAVHCRGANYHGEGGSPTLMNDGMPDTVVPGADAITLVYPSPGVSFVVQGKTKLDKKKKTYSVTTALTAGVPALVLAGDACTGKVTGSLKYSYKKYKKVKGKRKKVTVKKTVAPKANLLVAGAGCGATLKFKLPVKYLNKKRVTFSVSSPANTALAAFSATTAKYRLPKVKVKKKS